MKQVGIDFFFKCWLVGLVSLLVCSNKGSTEFFSLDVKGNEKE